jgi:hypothetical protein
MCECRGRRVRRSGWIGDAHPAGEAGGAGDAAESGGADLSGRTRAPLLPQAASVNRAAISRMRRAVFMRQVYSSGASARQQQAQQHIAEMHGERAQRDQSTPRCECGGIRRDSRNCCRSRDANECELPQRAPQCEQGRSFGSVYRNQAWHDGLLVERGVQPATASSQQPRRPRIISARTRPMRIAGSHAPARAG